MPKVGMSCRTLALVLFGLAGVGAPPASHAATTRAYSLDWLQVIPQHPGTVLIGGGIGDPSCDTEVAGCGGWALRSADGGRSWHQLNLPKDLQSGQQGPHGNTPYQPVVGADGRHMLMIVEEAGPTPGSTVSALSISTDGGVHWSDGSIDQSSEQDGYGAGPTQLIFSPARPSRVYAVDNIGKGQLEMAFSDDWGATWTTAVLGDPNADTSPNSLLPDPTQAATVYALTYTTSGTSDRLRIDRSQDGGADWSAIKVPDGGLGATLSLDRYEPGMLELTTARTPHGHVYLSADHGKSWQLAPCPGRLPSGDCPSALVDNLFGAGHAYAVGPGGIYRFDAAGAARARLAISTRLPIPMAGLKMLTGGLRYGDPIYLLGSATPKGALRLYRSEDAGRSWQRPAYTPSA